LFEIEPDTDGYSFHDLDTFWVRRQFKTLFDVLEI